MLSKVRRRRLRIRRRDEGGAVAIITAMMCVVLFGIAALSVDLGNAFARRTDTQTQADYGAFAAARLQKDTAKAGMTISTAMADAVRDAMNNNQPQDDSGTCWTSKSCVTSAELIDGNLTNGEVRYCGTGGPTCGSGYASTVKGIQVLAPTNKIDYGFANALGVDSGFVGADALVDVFTAGKRVMPMYAVQGCDYGLQTLTDPASGHTTPVVPTLAYDTQPTPPSANATDLDLGSVLLKDSTGALVSTLTKNTTGYTVSFSASKWSDTRYIGFFRDNDPDPSLVLSANSWWQLGDATKANLNTGTGYTTSGAASKSVELNIPANVTQTEAVWYIRVFNGPDGTGQWSEKDEALPFRVGEAILQCDSGSMAGNFGTLKFPRTDVATANEIAANIALGLQKPLEPTVHTYAIEHPPAGLCTAGLNEAVVSSGTTLLDGTNCVDTDTGLTATVATEGLVTGGTYGPGVLTTANTTPGCSPTGGDANRNIKLSGTQYSVNNDTLTCFLTDGTTSLLDIAKESYNGKPKLSAAILHSPRFFYVPVLAIQPGTGGSQTYSIVDFRAAFITDEKTVSTSIKGSKSGTADNGLWTSPSELKIDELKVVFFSDNALPTEGDIPLIDFLGTGNRVIRLID